MLTNEYQSEMHIIVTSEYPINSQAVSNKKVAT